jgi:hypothetical protein
MPALSLPAITIAITAASSSALTCASTTGLFVGQEGWAVKSDGTGNLQVIISQVIDGSNFLCQSYTNKNNAGGVDLSTYNGGKIYFYAQVVSVEPGASSTITA